VQISGEAESGTIDGRERPKTPDAHFYWRKFGFQKPTGGLKICGMAVAKSKNS
jgi:hypothetical protein